MHPPVLRRMMLKDLAGRCENYKCISADMSHTKSPFQLVENELRDMTKSYQSKGRKASKAFVEKMQRNL